jgi:hypothetical protein
MTDARRRAELEKPLAPIREGRRQVAQSPVPSGHKPSPATPPSFDRSSTNWQPPSMVELDREAVIRDQEQSRLQAAYEQAQKVKAAGMARGSRFRGQSKEERSGPHYATPDGLPYRSQRSRRD